MKGKILLGSMIALALVFSGTLGNGDLFGIKAAFGYGGSGGGSSIVLVPSCTTVTYGDWQACVSGFQYRNIIAQNPFNCQLTASEQAGRSQTCTPAVSTSTSTKQVLGEKKYADGTLLRGSNGRTYIVVGGKLKYINTLSELAKYNGKEIIKVDSSVINAFQMVGVLGAKKYGEGQLIRNGDDRIFVIINGKKKHIINLAELAKYYFGKQIYKVSAEELEQY
jgi:hypothetical protein